MEPCVSCGKSDFKSVRYINDHYPNTIIDWDNMHIRYCTHCGLGVVDPAITPETLLTFYKEMGSTNATAYTRNFFPARVEPAYMAQALTLFQFADVFDKQEVRYLDIGCGAFGYSFNAVTKLYTGKKVICAGVEVDPIAVKVMKKNGIEHVGEKYSDINNTASQFDLITMSHYFEHLGIHDGIQCLTAVKKNLAPYGAMLIEVPHDDFRQDIRHGIPSSPHTAFFTKQALVNVATKCGLEVAYAEALGPDTASYWEAKTSRENPTQGIHKLVRQAKNMLPVHVKAGIKNTLTRQSLAAICAGLMKPHRTGSFLRAVVRHPSQP